MGRKTLTAVAIVTVGAAVMTLLPVTQWRIEETHMSGEGGLWITESSTDYSYWWSPPLPPSSQGKVAIQWSSLALAVVGGGGAAGTLAVGMRNWRRTSPALAQAAT